VRGKLTFSLIVSAAMLLSAAPAHAADFRAGVATSDTTPPPFSAADDARDLGPQGAACLTAYFNGPRQFRFEEPYHDENGNGVFDYKGGDQFCDANANKRWDGIYSAGAAEHLAQHVKEDDRPRARAFAISDGKKTTIFVSVTAEGIFQNYTEDMRAATLASPDRASSASVPCPGAGTS